MNSNEPRATAASVLGTAVTLRRLFDEGFARPATSTAERVEGLLAVRIAADPYAFRLAEIAGLHVDLKIVPVPSPVAPLLGIVGVRGTMAPIYDLAALLRYPPTASPRWIVFARAPQRVGFAFEAFESHQQVSEETLVRGEGETTARGVHGAHLRGTVRVAGALRPIIHLGSVVAMLGDNNS